MTHQYAYNLLTRYQYLVGKIIRLNCFEFRITKLELKGKASNEIVCVYLAPEELADPPSNLWRELFSLSQDINLEDYR